MRHYLLFNSQSLSRKLVVLLIGSQSGFHLFLIRVVVRLYRVALVEGNQRFIGISVGLNVEDLHARYLLWTHSAYSNSCMLSMFTERSGGMINARQSFPL